MPKEKHTKSTKEKNINNTKTRHVILTTNSIINETERKFS